MSSTSFNVKKSLGFKAQAVAPVSPDLGEIYLSTDGNHYRWDGDVWRNLASGGATTFNIEQTAHAFVVGNAIFHNGTTWVKGRADDGDTLSTAVVVEVTDANNFIAANFGRFEVTGHGLGAAGEFYYLSSTVAGESVTVEPIAPNFSCPLFFIEDANFIQVLCYRPARQDLESYLGSNQYSAESTASQTVINLGFWVDLDSKPNFDLFIDGAFLREGAANDYQFTNVVANQSNQVTLTSPIAAGLNIVATYRGIYQQIDSMPNPMTTEGDIIRGAASGTPERLAIGDSGTTLRSDGTTANWFAPGIIPSLTGTYSVTEINKILEDIHKKNVNAGFGTATYAHGVTAVSNAYQGGVYSPTQNRIYLVPQIQAPEANWHYIDCATGLVVAYAHGVTAVASAYVGGVYSPTQNRIYLVPFNQTSQANWHYIDCATGTVFAYAHGVTAVSNAYVGGVYSPTQNRIYLVPSNQAPEANWHYIDCATGTVVAYAHGVTAVSGAYQGGVYSPTQNRIYLVPSNQAPEANWHYIDCATGLVVAYAHGVTAVSGAYQGGVYSPTQNRIYLVPFIQAPEANWHYIDCATGTVVAYTHGVTAVSAAYIGGVYSPTQNRIYLVPREQAPQTNWHYIDCATGSVVAYAHGVTAVVNAYSGGVYAPTQNRIYLVPHAQANQTNWHYIQPYTQAEIAPQIMAHGLFNKF